MYIKVSMSGLKGYTLLDDKGQSIGKRYSLMSLTTTVEVLGNNTVSIYTPTADEKSNIFIRERDLL